MFEKIASTTKSVKTTVVNHRAKIAAATTAVAFLALMARNAKELNAFLEEHNLLDEYYTPES